MQKSMVFIFGLLALLLAATGCSSKTAVSPPQVNIEGPAFILFYTDN